RPMPPREGPPPHASMSLLPQRQGSWLGLPGVELVPHRLPAGESVVDDEDLQVAGGLQEELDIFRRLAVAAAAVPGDRGLLWPRRQDRRRLALAEGRQRGQVRPGDVPRDVLIVVSRVQERGDLERVLVERLLQCQVARLVLQGRLLRRLPPRLAGLGCRAWRR